MTLMDDTGGVWRRRRHRWLTRACAFASGCSYLQAPSNTKSSGAHFAPVSKPAGARSKHQEEFVKRGRGLTSRFAPAVPWRLERGKWRRGPVGGKLATLSRSGQTKIS